MTESDSRCELCDLPLSQCVHGRPPPVVEPAPKSAPRTASPRKRAATVRVTAPAKVVSRRWTRPEELEPLILAVLREAGGELDAGDLFGELEVLAGERFRPGDREKTPAGELRWQYAARRARLALIEQGAMTKGAPGVWKLAPPG